MHLLALPWPVCMSKQTACRSRTETFAAFYRRDSKRSKTRNWLAARARRASAVDSNSTARHLEVQTTAGPRNARAQRENETSCENCTRRDNARFAKRTTAQ
ncbi:hypothetical protein EVAR_76231_1 [Eumeta japonica]|uniref:Uncharacterized protein n=1 Tax=Eumeta variegata TaxID=151549 RepID=A0A4C1UQ05_EUMVA|nr:hypothetical protein EVAR_76231_1 [Eumeta japonica]